ncbi:T7SS effector LXG polymorphic toxin, partial [Bacillus cereus]|uniref:T7SS effector LXG polymorphic toxin n=1 Tax=Bacillus cereus TaxID=1396 RepID=UPI0020C97349
MSLNMYLGEVHNQTQSMNAVCTATIQGMEQVIQSIDAFTSDTVLQGQTYDSAKAFFAETFRPLAQGIIYLCEELIRQNDAFPSQFQSQVASTDVIEQEILEQIREIDRMIASTEALNQAIPISGMDAMVNLFAVMRRKLQEKLEHLYEFNQTSSDNYNTAIQLAASIATGLAEVQSGKGFSPASGTFSTQGLNMEWATSIQSITQDRKRQADNSIEEGAMCGKIPPQSEQSFWDRNKKDLNDAWTGISTGVVDGVVDAWDGFVALGDKETWLNMRDAIVNYEETLPAAWNALSDSFMNEFWNGDMESREHYAAYAVTCYEVTFVNSFSPIIFFLMAYKSFRNKIYRQLTTLLFVDWLP